ncbi:IS1634 family transposase [Dietzia cinnamea]|uniref:DDE family transposase n=1 Tax=Dietzia cinnamea TaxID=321318 RepID=A0A4R3ZMA1_9ACTN|nr:IS1634 family transposase [Dietzia cinnamea]TCW18205.1 DDE family transposase [Dietzia cinnamea]
MYIRTAKRRTRTGEVSYVQLAHNEWDPVKARSVAKVLHSFGRAEQVDEAGLRRLVSSVRRYLGEEDPDQAGGPGLEPTASRPAGGALLLDGLWRQLGLDAVITSAAQSGRGRKRDLQALERTVFALVASRALAPSSKLAAADWANHDVAIPGLADAAGEVDEDSCYRAMDWLHDAGTGFDKAVFDQVADLLNLEVDLLFFDTTSTYFETDPDEAVLRDEAGHPVDPDNTGANADDSGGVGFRTHGKSKDHRDDLPQIVIGMAVTRTGIPIRVWCWPGNTADSALIRQVRSELRDWSLSRIIYAADRGFTSKTNRHELMAGGDGYILGEKLRGNSPEARAALSRPGKYRQVRQNLHVKEVNIAATTGATDRFVVCFNPAQAQRDAHTRDELVTKLSKMIAGTDKRTETKRAELKGRISTMPGLNRYLRTTPGGLLRIDNKAIEREANLDGKYLLRTSDPHLSAEDIALCYKQLLEVERGWRDMKSTLDLRPVYHRREDRIRSHVKLCWLALLMIRLAENRTGHTWAHIRRHTQRLHQVTLTGPDGTAEHLTRPTAEQNALFTATGLAAPTRLTGLTPAA